MHSIFVGMHKALLTGILQMKALAETGLVYAKNEYDIDRYQELQQLSLTMLSQLSGQSLEEWQLHLPQSKDYPTAKVDIRCLILSPEQKILLVQESIDGKWSLPGGWADVGYSPKETAIKECREETGLEVTVKALLAVFDKKMHPHPFEPFYVYKMVFLCQPLSTDIAKGWDVLDVRYFDINELPELSENRILKSQIERVYQKVMESSPEAYFD